MLLKNAKLKWFKIQDFRKITEFTCTPQDHEITVSYKFRVVFFSSVKDGVFCSSKRLKRRYSHTTGGSSPCTCKVAIRLRNSRNIRLCKGKTVIWPLFILLCIFRQKNITVFPLEIFTFGLLCNLSSNVRTGSHRSPTCINYSYAYAFVRPTFTNMRLEFFVKIMSASYYITLFKTFAIFLNCAFP